MIAYLKKKMISKSKLEPIDSEVTLTQPPVYKDTKKKEKEKEKKEKEKEKMIKHAAEYLSLK